MNNKQLQTYEGLGWKFWLDQDISHHNGDIDDELWAKSPRLKKGFCAASSRHAFVQWSEVSEEKLLGCESIAFAEQEYLNNQAIIQYQIEIGLAAGQRMIVVDLDADYGTVLKERYP